MQKLDDWLCTHGSYNVLTHTVLFAAFYKDSVLESYTPRFYLLLFHYDNLHM